MITVSVSTGDSAATIEMEIDHWSPDIVSEMVGAAVKAAVLARRLDAEVESDG